MPHLGHATVLATVVVKAGVLADVAIGVLTISSRSGNGRRDTCSLAASVVAGVEGGVHTVHDIDPGVPENARLSVASEYTQAAPQSSCLNDTAL